MRRAVAVSELSNKMEVNYLGEDKEINGLNLCNRFSQYENILSYATDNTYVDIVKNNKKLACLIVNEKHLDIYKPLIKERGITLMPCAEPETVFYDIHEYLYEKTDFYEKYMFDSKIGEKCKIHESAIIEDGVRIGNYVTIGANSVIKKGTVIKEFCSVGCNTVVGAEGFQIIKEKGWNRRIEHSGGILIEQNVSIGDNVTIGNSLFENTAFIGKNVMIDNLAYIGHNVVIEKGVVITAGTVLCGSVTVKSGAWIGPNSSILNRVVIGEGAKIGMGSVVTRDIPKKTLAYGVPAKVRRMLEMGNE